MKRDTYVPSRPVMGRKELRAHLVRSHGRDYAVSCDGYEDMESARDEGWHPVAGWGQDGWDLGSWPYVAIYRRERDGRHEMMQVVEGDHDQYAFPTLADLEAALDYLFLWYAAGESWCPIPLSDKDRIGSSGFEVEARFRGPFTWARCNGTGDEARAP